jgi:hypothetical protein
MREALLDGQLGRLVDPNVPEELVNAIAHVVKCFDVAHFR